MNEIIFYASIFTNLLTFDKMHMSGEMPMQEYISQQFISRKELGEAGYTNYKINKLIEEEKLEPINRRFFENPDFDGEVNELYAAPAYAPNGVVCLMSAAVYHGLSTHRPNQIDIAIPRKSRMPESPDWPRMQFYLFSGNRYDTGIMKITEGDNYFSIYDKEKTVCDVLFYRNKLGFEMAIEVMKTYLNQSDRDLNKLMGYAENLRSGKLVREYLEVMV